MKLRKPKVTKGNLGEWVCLVAWGTIGLGLAFATLLGFMPGWWVSWWGPFLMLAWAVSIFGLLLLLDAFESLMEDRAKRA